ncbi:MAG: hypothetical protein ACRC0F_04550 [Cetobacterium sp.]
MIYGIINIKDLSTGGEWQVEKWFNEENPNLVWKGIDTYVEEDREYRVVLEIRRA